MKKLIALTVLGSLSYAGFMLVELPAAFVWEKAPAIKGVELSGLSGTVWSGSAQTINVQGVTLEDLRWQVRPGALLSGSVEVDLQLGDGFSAVAGQGTLTYKSGVVQINDLVADVAADWLQQQASMSIPAAFSTTIAGNFNLVADSLVYAEGHCTELDAQFVWERGRISSPLGDLSLGQASADLSCQGNNLQATARQTSDQLQTDLTFSLNRNRSYTLRGGLVSGDEMPEAMQQGLRFLGQPDEDGRYSLSFRGRI